MRPDVGIDVGGEEDKAGVVAGLHGVTTAVDDDNDDDDDEGRFPHSSGHMLDLSLSTLKHIGTETPRQEEGGGVHTTIPRGIGNSKHAYI